MKNSKKLKTRNGNKTKTERIANNQKQGSKKETKKWSLKIARGEYSNTITR